MSYASTARPQEQPDLDALVSKAAASIHKSAKSKAAKVLVIDFAQHHAPPNELGVALADQFTASLNKNSQGLVVIDRSDYAPAVADDRLKPEARTEKQTAHCYCRQFQADFAVEGTITAGSDKLVLNLEVTRLDGWKTIFHGQASLALTSDLQALLSKNAAVAPAQSQTDNNTWVSPGRSPSIDSPAVPKGGTYPSCIHCPFAEFSSEAVNAIVQGTVLLKVVVDTEGHPTSISVVQGLPCNLNRSAMAAVKRWTFKPAKDPNGKPIEVSQTVEVTFHLY